MLTLKLSSGILIYILIMHMEWESVWLL